MYCGAAVEPIADYAEMIFSGANPMKRNEAVIAVTVH